MFRALPHYILFNGVHPSPSSLEQKFSSVAKSVIHSNPNMETCYFFQPNVKHTFIYVLKEDIFLFFNFTK